MIEQVKFGTTKEGAEASIYILENSNGMHVQVSDFGALILTIMIPDKNGNIKDVTLGFDELDDYYNTDTGFGAYVGRNANRIKNACVTIEGKEYRLDKNDGENNLHSGFVRSHCMMYDTVFGKNGPMSRLWTQKVELFSPYLIARRDVSYAARASSSTCCGVL